MTRIIATVQVRMGSERLPGKPLRPIGGIPLLQHLLERVRQVKGLDDIVVATPESAENDPIEEFCAAHGTPCFRGSEEDVTERMLGALQREGADVGIEVYGDSPLSDPAVIGKCLHTFLECDSYDLVGNDLRKGYPSGTFTEAFSVEALKRASRDTRDPAIREHGTLVLRNNPKQYALYHLEPPEAHWRPDIHLDVDTQEDAEVIEAIVQHFAPRNDFTLEEVIAFLDAHPDIADRNRHVHRRWKQYQHT